MKRTCLDFFAGSGLVSTALSPWFRTIWANDISEEKYRIQRILADHGITRVLAEEGGRTSRGSVGLMQKYVEFLNFSGYSRRDPALQISPP